MTKKTSKKTTVIFVLLVLVLVAANGFQFYTNLQSTEKHKEVVENNALELVTTFAKLDSISEELDGRIFAIDNLGGNIDSLIMVKEQLERDKRALKNSARISKKRYDEIKEKVDAYETLLVRKDEEIVKLKEVNEVLLSETIDLKTERNQLNSTINNLSEVKSELENKIASAAVLKARNITFRTANAKGKEYTGSQFKVRHIQKLNIDFFLEKNDLVEVGTKDIIVRIIEPEGSALYNIAAGSGTFTFNGGEMFYTTHKEILFDNSGQNLSVSFIKGSQFKKGVHKVEVYTGGVLVGENSFLVK